MSMEIMTRVWECSKQKGTPLLLMLAIADNANHEGVAFPGVPYLARKTRMSERQVQRVLQTLDDSGELAVVWSAGRKNTNIYYVLVGTDTVQLTKLLLEIEEIRKERAKNGDKMTPLSNPKPAANGDKMSPLNEKKGDISGGKGDIFSANGDIAMSPEPLTINPLTKDIEDAWNKTSLALRDEQGRGFWATWVVPAVPVGVVGNTFQIRVMNRPALKKLTPLEGRISELVSSQLGRQVTARIEVG